MHSATPLALGWKQKCKSLVDKKFPILGNPKRQMLKEWHLDILKSKPFHSKLISAETDYYERMLKIKVACALQRFIALRWPHSQIGPRDSPKTLKKSQNS